MENRLALVINLLVKYLLSIADCRRSEEVIELTPKGNYRKYLYLNTLVIVILGAVVAGWGVIMFFPSNIGEGYHNALAAVQAIRRVLFWKVAIIYITISLCTGLAIVVLHLFYSHRIAGPAYRISLEAAKIAGGDLAGNVKLRSKDNLTDIKDVLNDLALQYSGRISDISDSLTVIGTQTVTMNDLIQKGSNQEALGKISQEITSNLKKIEQTLSELRV